MTTIDELEGEDLARAVALKRGYTYAPFHEIGNGDYVTDYEAMVWRNPSGSVCPLPRPDKHIAQAWDLVETMRENGYLLNPLRHSYLGFSISYIARFIHEDGDGLPWEAGFIGTGITASTAICRAYLKAMAAREETTH